MKITQEQLDFLDRFSCERLSEHLKHKEILNNFYNSRGETIVNYFKNKAWSEDNKGDIAYYLIKSPIGDVVMFFSLKCGFLFNPFNEDEINEKFKKNKQKLLNFLAKKKKSEKKVNFKTLKRKYKLGKQTKKYYEKVSLLKLEKEKEVNKKIIRVENTYPSVELVHFCVNDSAKEYWKKNSNCNHTLGEVMFWKFIVPIIFKIQSLIGCQYLFLFAADMSEDNNLINYYNVALKFEQPEHIGTNKPKYDFCCRFMCQEINTLKTNQEEYFENFNPNDDDVLI